MHKPDITHTLILCAYARYQCAHVVWLDLGARLTPVIGAVDHLSNNAIGQCTETRYIYSA